MHRNQAHEMALWTILFSISHGLAWLRLARRERLATAQSKGYAAERPGMHPAWPLQDYLFFLLFQRALRFRLPTFRRLLGLLLLGTSTPQLAHVFAGNS
jgi:hypothetical protein